MNPIQTLASRPNVYKVEVTSANVKVYAKSGTCYVYTWEQFNSQVLPKLG